MRVVDLNIYDAIFGYDWLKPRSPMNYHWANKSVEFEEQGKLIKIQGVLTTKEPAVHEISAHQLLKWAQGNDIWACAVLKLADENNKQHVDQAVKTLLHEFKDIFSTPTTLPPQRSYDHVIPLLPNVFPVNSKHYRYSPAHKDEIEQVRELLEAGLITHSASPFASPILLVQKKDGSWRFCVDYNKLNSITVKNRFPIPIIDEILDELFGAKFFTTLDMRVGYHQIESGWRMNTRLHSKLTKATTNLR
jgi:hypothetical protein